MLFSTQGDLPSKWKELEAMNILLENIIFSTDQTENEYSMSYYAPKFIWLLKDFVIQEQDENGLVMQPDKYLELRLREIISDREIFQNKEIFLNIFKERFCLDFEEVSNQGTNFRKLAQNLTPYYKDQICYLKELIYSTSTVKNYDGMTFSPRMTINFINCVIELFNNAEKINYYEM